MIKAKQDNSPIAAVAVGLLGLAAAMGIGRFAFTPILPLMQERAQLTLAEGGWLATANYAGYLAGALLCIVASPRPGVAARLGLVGVGLFTIGMGVTRNFEAWMVLRFLAGIASALAFVGISNWSLGALAQARCAHWAGWVFGGVGIGIAVAGIVGLVAGVAYWEPSAAWLVLGAIALVVAPIAWRRLSVQRVLSTQKLPATSPRFDRAAWLLVLCYVTFGFGYIIPATFLPALARGRIADPSVFGWIWPVFGAAAAVSTLVASFLFHATSPRRVWAYGQLVLAVGVVAPVVMPGVGALLLAAVCVGGTFMVITMAGMQEARRAGGNAAPRLVAAMTAAFGVGQMLGPVAVNAASAGTNPIAMPSLAAALLLLVAAATLFLTSPGERKLNIEGEST